jgi:hypothetical protein
MVDMVARKMLVRMLLTPPLRLSDRERHFSAAG